MRELHKCRIILIVCFLCIFACDMSKATSKKNTFFIGVDVSGSFTKTKSFSDGMKFLSYFIYGHLKGASNLAVPKDLYVGGIGGIEKNDPQAFFPIHDFKDLQPSQIEKKLVDEFSKQHDRLTDFNIFFERVALTVKQKNLVLAPINIILVTDGVPEVIKGNTDDIKKQAYSKLNMAPIEYLSRNVNLRILYASPKVGYDWIKFIPRKRVKIMAVEAEVMYGWEAQLKKSEEALWTWIQDNVDRRIYMGVFNK